MALLDKATRNERQQKASVSYRKNKKKAEQEDQELLEEIQYQNKSLIHQNTLLLQEQDSIFSFLNQTLRDLSKFFLKKQHNTQTNYQQVQPQVIAYRQHEEQFFNEPFQNQQNSLLVIVLLVLLILPQIFLPKQFQLKDITLPQLQQNTKNIILQNILTYKAHIQQHLLNVKLKKLCQDFCDEDLSNQ